MHIRQNNNDVFLERFKKLVVIAIFSDDLLMETFVLKGGNALHIVHNIGGRASVDIDLSMAGDFDDFNNVKIRTFATLRKTFLEEGLSLFDEKFEKKPDSQIDGQDPQWGGYQITFKVSQISKGISDNIEKQRRRAVSVTTDEKRTFTIDISKHEYCEKKESKELDDYLVYVYTLPMIAIEKLRAICQQMKEYPIRPKKAPRPRDFYDIYNIVNQGGVVLNSPENIELFHHIFDAKCVNLQLLGEIKNYKAFHEQEWSSVKQDTPAGRQNFDFYFNFVINLVSKLNF